MLLVHCDMAAVSGDLEKGNPACITTCESGGSPGRSRTKKSEANSHQAGCLKEIHDRASMPTISKVAMVPEKG